MGFFDSLFAGKRSTPASSVTFHLDQAAHMYEDGNIGLEATTLDITPDSKRVAVIGLNGAGKTTLLQIMGTLDKADSGSIMVDGVDVGKLSSSELSKFRNGHIGFVFQFHQLLPEFTALENITIPAYIGGKNPKEAKERAMELLEFMGLADRASHKPAELSGGEKQLLALAAVLVTEPTTIIADEPTTLLDLRNRRRIIAELNSLEQQTIVVTHDLDLLVGFDRVICVNDGVIAHDGTPEDTIEFYQELMEQNSED